jgi:LAS superfamily LD-carboxypeptidase LdcB
MNRFLKKGIFFLFVISISLTLVASNGISHRVSSNIKTTEDCLVERISGNTKNPCTQATPTQTPYITPTPNLNLPEKDRFLAAVTNKLPSIPTFGTFEYILLRQYGAAFINISPNIKLPPKILLANDQETKSYQATLAMGAVNSGRNCYLQKGAADALNNSIKQANFYLKSGSGNGDCTRSYETNLRFWQKYANNSTLEEVKKGKQTAILGVVAPPGASQHLWGLAVDLRVSTQAQRQALNQNGWFQTVENDVPHWTYLGLAEDSLSQWGFRKKIVRGIVYWLTPL